MNLAASLGAVLLAMGAVPADARPRPDAPPSGPARSAGYYVLQLGSLKIVALSDGGRPLPYAELLTRTDPDRVRATLAEAFLASPLFVSVNAYLIDDGHRRVLIDAGSGSFLGPSAGFLPRSLAAAGYRPEQIDDIFVTHLGIDHCGGLSEGERRLFPNATVHLTDVEVAYWSDPAAEARAAPDRRAAFAKARAMIEPYAAVGRLDRFAAGSEPVPGVRTVARPGHTPGSVEMIVTSGQRSLRLMGDVLHSEQVQFAEPGVAIRFDVDQDAAVTSRRAALTAAAAKGDWVALAHVPFPGLGHVRAEGEGFRWYPATYGVDGP